MVKNQGYGLLQLVAEAAGVYHPPFAGKRSVFVPDVPHDTAAIVTDLRTLGLVQFA